MPSNDAAPVSAAKVLAGIPEEISAAMCPSSLLLLQAEAYLQEGETERARDTAQEAVMHSGLSIRQWAEAAKRYGLERDLQTAGGHVVWKMMIDGEPLSDVDDTAQNYELTPGCIIDRATHAIKTLQGWRRQNRGSAESEKSRIAALFEREFEIGRHFGLPLTSEPLSSSCESVIWSMLGEAVETPKKCCDPSLVKFPASPEEVRQKAKEMEIDDGRLNHIIAEVAAAWALESHVVAGRVVSDFSLDEKLVKDVALHRASSMLHCQKGSAALALAEWAGVKNGLEEQISQYIQSRDPKSSQDRVCLFEEMGLSDRAQAEGALAVDECVERRELEEGLHLAERLGLNDKAEAIRNELAARKRAESIGGEIRALAGEAGSRSFEEWREKFVRSTFPAENVRQLGIALIGNSQAKPEIVRWFLETNGLTDLAKVYCSMREALPFLEAGS